MRMNCTTIEMDDAALQSEHGREAAIGWVLRCPDCTPESLLHSSMCSALQNYLLGVTSNDAWLALPESACIKAILEIWGRSRSGEHVRKQVCQR